MAILWLALKVAGILLSAHVCICLVVIFTTRIEKDIEGNLILNPEWWHFKAVFPFKRHSSYFMAELTTQGVNMCPYVIKLTCMLLFGWPFLILIWGVKAVVLNGVFSPFGFYCCPSITWVSEEERLKKISWLPKIKNFIIFPAYIIFPLIYSAFFYFTPGTMILVTQMILVVIGVVVLFMGMIWLFSKIQARVKRSDSQKIYLVREFLSAKYRRYCPKMVLKISY